MKIKQKTMSTLASSAAFILLAHMANAGVNITNLNVVGNTLSFSLAGTIDDSATIGPMDLNRIFIGNPNNHDWILSEEATPTIVNNGGTGFRELSTSATGYSNATPYDFIYIYTADNQDWAIGDMVDASVSFTGGSLSSENIIKEEFIVSAGYIEENFFMGSFPDTATQIGTYSPVPEPKSTGLCVGAISLGGLLFSRRRKK